MSRSRSITLSPPVRHFLLAEPARFATLASINTDGTPHQAVVWYLISQDGELRVNSKEGRRWPANLRRDPRLSLSIEAGYDYVTLRGRAEVIEDRERAQVDIAAMARRYHPPDHAEELIQRTFLRQDRVSFVIHLERVTIHGEID